MPWYDLEAVIWIVYFLHHLRMNYSKKPARVHSSLIKRPLVKKSQTCGNLNRFQKMAANSFCAFVASVDSERAQEN